MATENELLARVERLEKQNLRIKLFGGFLILALASLVFAARLAGKKTLEAHEFPLKDQSGKVVARLGGDDWSTRLTLQGETKVAEAEICVGDEFGSTLALTNRHADGRVLRSAGYQMRESSDRVPGLIVSEGNGKHMIIATLGAETKLSVGSVSEENSIVLSAPQKGPTIKLSGSGDKPLWTAP